MTAKNIIHKGKIKDKPLKFAYIHSNKTIKSQISKIFNIILV